MSSPAASANSLPAVSRPVTFVGCVESGALEEQTVRMVQSLRRWGGRFRNSDVYAVKPRRGPKMATRTLRAFDELNVHYLELTPRWSYDWNQFLNKPLSIQAVARRAITPLIGWLDADLLFTQEPDGFDLPVSFNATAAPTDVNIGTSGPGDPNDSFWQACTRAIGIDIDALPHVTTYHERKNIRLYFNSGVFLFSRATAFADEYVDACLAAIGARIAHRVTGVHFFDQVFLGMVFVKLGMAWRELRWDHNFAVASFLKSEFDPNGFAGAKIVHYHDAMRESFFETFVGYFNASRPDIATWLREAGPSTLASAPPNISQRAMRLLRIAGRRVHLARSTVY